MERRCPYLSAEELKQGTGASSSKYSVKSKAAAAKEDDKKRPVVSIGDVEFESCPTYTVMTNRWAMTLISLCQWHESTHLPFSTSLGTGMLDQSALAFDVFTLFCSVRADIQAFDMKETRSKSSDPKKKIGAPPSPPARGKRTKAK